MCFVCSSTRGHTTVKNERKKGERRKEKGERRKEKGERRKEKGERRKEKGERRKEKGERREEKGERRKEKGERRKREEQITVTAGPFWGINFKLQLQARLRRRINIAFQLQSGPLHEFTMQYRNGTRGAESSFAGSISLRTSDCFYDLQELPSCCF